MPSSSSSSTLPIPALATQQINLLFAVYAQVIVPATYYRAGQGVPVSCLILPVSLALADGTIILPGDEKVLIRARELASVTEPRAGDYLEETTSGQRRDVVVVQLDLTRQIWTLFARKVLS